MERPLPTFSLWFPFFLWKWACLLFISPQGRDGRVFLNYSRSPSQEYRSREGEISRISSLFCFLDFPATFLGIHYNFSYTAAWIPIDEILPSWLGTHLPPVHFHVPRNSHWNLYLLWGEHPNPPPHSISSLGRPYSFLKDSFSEFYSST
jgi:hypothetical protein